jgi:hypothetical protein
VSRQGENGGLSRGDWHRFGPIRLDPPSDPALAAVFVPARDGFVDPPGVLVRGGPRRPTVAALLREGSGRLWLFRRHPERFPLPKPHRVGIVRWVVMLVGALRANARPPA